MRTNTERAARARSALDAQNYGEGRELSVDPVMAYQAVKDLLTDLRHLCDGAGVDFAAADRCAYDAYCDERAHEPAAAVRIAAVAFEDREGRCTAVARLDDGRTERLFTFYADELSFSERDLVGLSVAQARALRHERDVAYLRGGS